MTFTALRLFELILFFHIFQPLLVLYTHCQQINQQNDVCEPDQRMQVFCYIGLWYPETYSRRFSEDDMDPYLCTHVILAYFTFKKEGGNYVFAPYERGDALTKSLIDRSSFKRSTQYLLCVGGFVDFDIDKYTQMARNPRMRKIFAKNVMALLKLHRAHGVDFMWNYIGRRDYADTGDKVGDMHNLAQITEDLCDEMKKGGFLCVITLVKVEKRSLMSHKDYQANITAVVRAADFINIWTVDIIPVEFSDGSQSLMPQGLLIPTDNADERSYYDGYEDKSVNFVLDFYKTVLRNSTEHLRKLSLTVTLQFGAHGFRRGENASINTHTAMHTNDNPITGDRRYQYPYFEICKNLLEDTSRWELIEFPGGVPVAIDHGLDTASKFIGAIPTVTEAYVRKKVAFARSQNLGGITIFHITADDILGLCSNQTFPILNAINEELNGCRYV
ncbi:unnamed protein product [Allacma fusca]|uniref:GH18 domain-containing protein n=1 Tax=Allacma fusca TaxID=39272 RepID=A0A8J2NUU6_9HEXA|nr:unnamed protein product [Allacma fusca]